MDHKHVAVEDLETFARETILTAGEKALSFYGQGVPEVKFDRALGTEAELQLNHWDLDTEREDVDAGFYLFTVNAVSTDGGVTP